MEKAEEKNIEIAEQDQLLFETRSEDVQEIIGKMPSWIIQWGITIISLIVIAALTVSGFIKSPEIGSYPVLISKANSDTTMKSVLDGRVKTLFVQNGSLVAKGDPLILLDNDADLQDVLKAKLIAQTIDTSMSLVRMNDIENNLNLGELKYAYQSFIVSLKLFQEAKLDPALSYQIRENIRNSAREFVQLCNHWENRYLIKSAGEGKVVFLKEMYPNVYIKNNEELLVVQGHHEEAILSIVGVAQNEMKLDLKKGQDINLKLLGFPFQEFGVIKGKIDKVSGKLPNGKCYIYIRIVNNKLQTTKGFDFNQYNHLSATGEVILCEKTILQKLLSRI